MTELIIDRELRLKLRAESHGMDPMVLLGSNGLTDAVIKEIEKDLKAHALVKIRLQGDDRDEREAVIQDILEKTGSARIQVIGKTVVIYRPLPEKEEVSVRTAGDAAEKRPRSRGGKILKTDKKRLKKTPIRRAHPKRKRTVKKALGS